MSSVPKSMVAKWITGIVNAVRARSGDPSTPVTIRLATRAFATNPGFFNESYMAMLKQTLLLLGTVQIVFPTHISSPSQILKIGVDGEYLRDSSGAYVFREDFAQTMQLQLPNYN